MGKCGKGEKHSSMNFFPLSPISLLPFSPAKSLAEMTETEQVNER
jgi:hypothetical protein